VTIAPAFLQVSGDVLASQHAGQVSQAPPTLGIIRIQDEKAALTLLVKCANEEFVPLDGKFGPTFLCR
jgi:hypothetical protein